MLKQRVVTAIIFGAIIVVSIFKMPNSWLAILFAAITLLGAWEWASLIAPQNLTRKLLYVVFMAALILVTWMLAKPYHIKITLLIAGLWWALVVIFLTVFDSNWLQAAWLQNLLEVSGFIVLVPAWLALVELHQQDHMGPMKLMFLLVLVWVADISAYFVGKRFGKTKLAPELSPGKSREGLWGALTASIIIAVLGIYLFKLDTKIWFYFGCLCLLTALISVVGDLYESLLKRHAGVKDSGTILPGHGGVLDRIDSLTAAAPGFVLGLYWVI